MNGSNYSAMRVFWQPLGLFECIQRLSAGFQAIKIASTKYTKSAFADCFLASVGWLRAVCRCSFQLPPDNRLWLWSQGRIHPVYEEHASFLAADLRLHLIRLPGDPGRPLCAGNA